MHNSTSILKNTDSAFRKDINGLRAYAVSFVVLFHFNVPGFNGGFVGVDVFFVISGFLMASIITKGLYNRNFSILSFYLSRFRRVLPALLLLLITLILAGWFLLPSIDYKLLSTQVGYSSIFSSNIYFWRNSNYFDTSAIEKWLLHTWTLGLEFQFYFFLPLFFLAVWRINKNKNALLIASFIAFFASLLLSVFISSWKQSFSFYLLPTRAWEFFAGCIIFLITSQSFFSKHQKNCCYYGGMLILLLSLFLIDDKLSWPSGWALIPVIATSLVIFSANQTSLLTSNFITQWLGTRSYSIYLWHWPIAVGLNFASLNNQLPWVFCGIILSLVLGHLSYKLIETPTQIILKSPKNHKQTFIFISIIISFFSISLVIKNSNIDFRLNSDVQTAANEALNRDPRIWECQESATENGSPSCRYGQGELAAILRGDSHAGAVATGLGSAASNYNKEIIFWGMSSCPTLDNIKHLPRVSESPYKCNHFNLWADKESKKYPNMPVVLVSRASTTTMGLNDWDKENEAMLARVYFSQPYERVDEPGYAEEAQNAIYETACRLTKERPVYLMRPLPEMKIDVPKTLSRNILFGRGNHDIKITLDEYHLRHKLVWEAQDLAAQNCGAKILNPLPHLCDQQYCYGSKDGRSLYSDDDHLSEFGNKLLVPMFEEIFATQPYPPSRH